jgi:hypothetical protein
MLPGPSDQGGLVNGDVDGRCPCDDGTEMAFYLPRIHNLSLSLRKMSDRSRLRDRLQKHHQVQQKQGKEKLSTARKSQRGIDHPTLDGIRNGAKKSGEN